MDLEGNGFSVHFILPTQKTAWFQSPKKVWLSQNYACIWMGAHKSLIHVEVSSRSASTFISIFLSFFSLLPPQPAAGLVNFPLFLKKRRISLFCGHIMESKSRFFCWRKRYSHLRESRNITRLNSPQEKIYEAIKETLSIFIQSPFSPPFYLVIYSKLLSLTTLWHILWHILWLYLTLLNIFWSWILCMLWSIQYILVGVSFSATNSKPVISTQIPIIIIKAINLTPFLYSPITLNISSVTIEYLNANPNLTGLVMRMDQPTNHKQ